MRTLVVIAFLAAVAAILLFPLVGYVDSIFGSVK